MNIYTKYEYNFFSIYQYLDAKSCKSLILRKSNQKPLRLSIDKKTNYKDNILQIVRVLYIVPMIVKKLLRHDNSLLLI